MKRLSLSLMLLIFLLSESFSQTLYDSFTDGDFTAAPVWGGNTTAWTIVANSDVSTGATGSNTVRLNAPGVTQTDYLSSQISNWFSTQEWGFWIGRRAQGYTLANQAYFWLYANETDLSSATVDGYRIAIGDDAGGDEIRLEYIVNGAVSATVITSTGAITNGLTDIGFLVRVTRTVTGQWTLYTSVLPTTTGTGAIATDIPNSANTTVNQGTGTNNSLAPASNGYIGFAALHTTGGNAIAGAEFDQIYFNQLTTISTGTVSSPPFVLASCAVTATGTVDFSSVGNFNPFNQFVAQLSNSAGSFASPVNIGSVSFFGVNPTATINITIPAGTLGGAGYLIRVVSTSPSYTGTSSAAFTITQNGVNGCMSSASDYFRSIQTGNWASTSTWESSPDNSNWVPATLIPTSAANTISIRTGHTVTLNTSQNADQLVIENGGVLVNQMPAANTFTIANASGDDMEIQNGGMYHILSTQGYANYQVITAGATIRIKSGGIIRLGDGTLLGGSNNGALASTSLSYIWEHNSVFEWNSSGAFTSSGVIYFPDVDAVTIPVFRTLVNIGSIGAAASTTFNGIFEANGNIIFQAAGTKTFRNGIRGSGNIDGVNGVTQSGTFIINGTTAELGGTGSLIVPSTGLEIGSASGTTVTVSSNKTVTGDVHMQTTNTYIELGNNNLTVTGNITGESTTSFVRTNGSGYLRMTDINTFISKLFPIGNTSFNPLVINHAGTNLLEYFARVENGINSPGPLLPTYGIDRTWYIGASAVAPSTSITFQYAAADANPGVLPTEEMEILRSDFTSWSILPGNMNILPAGTNPYTVSTATAITVNNSAQPYAIGKTGGYILPLDYFIVAKAEKRNTAGLISWNVFESGNVKSFELQRSVNNGAYTTIGNISPENNKLSYSYFETNLPAGTNLYRIKVNRNSGAVRYSNVVAIINDTKGLLITSLMPNPVTGSAVVTVSAARSLVADIQLVNVSGTIVRQWRSAVAEGSNQLTIDMSALPAGVYHLVLQTADSKAVYRLVKQ